MNTYTTNQKSNGYKVLGSTEVKGKFQVGKKYPFKATLPNIPSKWIHDYQDHRDFIKIRINNYFIPKLNTDYKTLMSYIRNKTIELLVQTPRSSKIFNVAIDKDNQQLNSILERVYKDNYTFDDTGKLFSISEFKNNEMSFESLSDLANDQENGRWYLLNSSKSEDSFKPGDRLYLHYLKDFKVAKIPKKKTVQYSQKVYDKGKENVIKVDLTKEAYELKRGIL